MWYFPEGKVSRDIFWNHSFLCLIFNSIFQIKWHSLIKISVVEIEIEININIQILFCPDYFFEVEIALFNSVGQPGTRGLCLSQGLRHLNLGTLDVQAEEVSMVEFPTPVNVNVKWKVDSFNNRNYFLVFFNRHILEIIFIKLVRTYFLRS